MKDGRVTDINKKSTQQTIQLGTISWCQLNKK